MCYDFYDNELNVPMEYYMSRMRKEKLNMVFGLTNVKRCLFAALLSIAVFPVLLVISAAEPDFAAPLLIPVAFFSVGSAAFAYYCIRWQGIK